MTSLIQRIAALPRDKTDALLLIFACAMVLLPFTEHSPTWINAIAGLLIAWRVWITLRGQVMPKKWLLTLISALLLTAVYLHFHTWLGKDAGIAFLIVLACLKMLEMHARRDAVAVIFASYFLLVGQLLYSQSLLTAMYLLLCICLLISAQLTFQYYQLTPSFPKRLASGFKIVGLAIPLALIFFLLFPRIQGPLWGKQQGNSGGITGLSDSMEPGNVAELALSDQIAFRVKFLGTTPAPSQLYWRAIVLDTFNGKRWSASSVSAPAQQESTPPAHGRQVTQEIIMEPHNQRWLFGLDRPTSITGSTELNSTLTRYWEMRSSSPIQERIRYTITSNLSNTANMNTAPPASLSERMAAERQSLLLPNGYNPLTLQWAQQFRQKSTDPAQLANLVLRFFREQPFRYTLAPPPLGVNQVDDFMFGTQAGFCEHYASAFVVVMRAMGIPARVVTGYQGGEVNPIDGLMTVRQSDAHAWAEIWLEAHGWVRFDPTAAVAPNRVEHGLNGSFPNRNFSNLLNFNQQTWLSNLAKEARLRWDATNSAWNLWALNYNLDKQKNLLSTLSGIEHPQATQLGVAMMIAASLVVAALSLLLLGKKTVHSPLDKLYITFCQYMSRQGYPRMQHEGARDYGQRLQLVFHNKKELADFLTLYTKCKYGKSYNSSHILTLKMLLKLCLQLKPSPV
ncbi:transglutaminaseTgpA domain-containing protein [Solimicrobium silvestre]|uniref:Transglutaminase-like domain-containing protein n=1 Tax=Solimicrobium silvestre TaxID=2099400 RepID=A0A2S9GXV8_9BURK|nr:DUF3488 and transglutaminase-like domain-containing protein [Solimicrobium silvestre]PRC92541.1 hypothetical protein S2091_2596 [Solimicrobium silvestre]